MTELDLRIPRPRTRRGEESEYFWKLIEPLRARETAINEQNYADVGTPGQRAIYTSLLFISDVNNGGLEQFLWNFDRWFVDATVSSLQLLGAREHASAIVTASKAFFGARGLEDQPKRQAAIDRRDRRWRDAQIEPLNAALYGEELLHPFLREYVEAHPAEFFVD